MKKFILTTAATMALFTGVANANTRINEITEWHAGDRVTIVNQDTGVSKISAVDVDCRAYNDGIPTRCQFTFNLGPNELAGPHLGNLQAPAGGIQYSKLLGPYESLNLRSANTEIRQLLRPRNIQDTVIGNPVIGVRNNYGTFNVRNWRIVDARDAAPEATETGRFRQNEIRGNAVYPQSRVSPTVTGVREVYDFQADDREDTINPWLPASVYRVHPETGQRVLGQTRRTYIHGLNDGTHQFEQGGEYVLVETVWNERNHGGAAGAYHGGPNVPHIAEEATITEIRYVFDEPAPRAYSIRYYVANTYNYNNVEVTSFGIEADGEIIGRCTDIPWQSHADLRNVDGCEATTTHPDDVASWEFEALNYVVTTRP